MKIAIPSEGKNLESVVCQSFGRTPYFIVADSKTLEFEVIDNQAAASQGGAGVRASQTIIDSGAKVIVTFRCGQNAQQVLQAGGIKIMRAIPGTIKDMLAKYEAGELSELTEFHAGYHNHGGA